MKSSLKQDEGGEAAPRGNWHVHKTYFFHFSSLGGRLFGKRGTMKEIKERTAKSKH
jgi:hypothetical protein